MLGEPVTESLIDIIRRGRGAHDTAGFLALKREAEGWRPEGYDEHQQILRREYEGKIAERLVEHVRRRYPHSHQAMPLRPFNWAKVYAENGAAVYDYPAQRHLAIDGERLEDDQRAADFAVMLREAQLDVVLAEAERRLVLARSIFLRVHSDSVRAAATGTPPPTSVTIFWPRDVLVIPHPRCPTSLSTSVAVLARVAGDGGVRSQSTSWEVWTRAFDEDGDGNVVRFGPWRAERVLERVEHAGARSVVTAEVTPLRFGGQDLYPLPTLPFVEWHAGVPDGIPVLDADRNLADIFAAVNEGLMAEAFAVDMNSASPLVRKSNDVAPQQIALGPGLMPTIPTSDDIQAIPMSADFAGIRGVQRATLANLALTSRQRTEGFDVEAQGQPVSGVALKIKNEPQAKARLEAVARAIEMERRLLSVMVEVHDYFRGTSIAGDGITYTMVPQDPPEYEDREVTQRRAIEAMTAGLISAAEARVLSGYSRTAEEAAAALEKIREEKAARASPMRQALEAAAAGEGEPEADPPRERAIPETFSEEEAP